MAKSAKEYLAWLDREKCVDNPFNYYRFLHGFTAYHVGELMRIPQTNISRYVNPKKLPRSVDVFFRALNKLDTMHADGSANLSSLDLFVR